MSFQSRNDGGDNNNGSRCRFPTRQTWVPRGSNSSPPVNMNVNPNPPLSFSSRNNGNGGHSSHGTGEAEYRSKGGVNAHRGGQMGRGKERGMETREVKDPSLPQLAQEIQEKLVKSTVECMICYDMVRRSAPIWSCSSCFSIFHLNCIKKWARTPASVDLITEKNQGFNWRCPGCQSVQLTSLKDIRYACFCGKRTDPPSDLYLTPHSCGEPCGKQLEKEVPGADGSKKDLCPHNCVLQCHPGPCPPCKAFARPKSVPLWEENNHNKMC
ncbi:hypothetical protein OIU77_000816 [Salix suchowensis]|uniref:Uncharacterized protein n=1 Tax=Salix suchowensis TaxID=1278906 RepID=A0ABQ9B7G4_9ROSI|nr:hypothetical protein OIU77_000816 [Salix suchowensis]